MGTDPGVLIVLPTGAARPQLVDIFPYRKPAVCLLIRALILGSCGCSLFNSSFLFATSGVAPHHLQRVWLQRKR